MLDSALVALIFASERVGCREEVHQVDIRNSTITYAKLRELNGMQAPRVQDTQVPPTCFPILHHWTRYHGPSLLKGSDRTSDGCYPGPWPGGYGYNGKPSYRAHPHYQISTIQGPKVRQWIESWGHGKSPNIILINHRISVISVNSRWLRHQNCTRAFVGGISSKLTGHVAFSDKIET